MPAGEYVYFTASVMRSRPLLQVDSNSGGVILASGPTASITLKNITGNSDVYVGGSGTEAPFSGNGFLLAGGEGISMGLPNFNTIRVFATASGQFVTYFGVG